MPKENNQSIEQLLWDSFDRLRGAVEAGEYKHIVLSLIFLKYANDRFNIQREKLIEQGYDDFLEELPFYEQDNVFYIPEEARWDYIIENAKQDDITVKIDTALHRIEEENPALKGALPENYFTRLNLAKNTVAALLDNINKVSITNEDDDLFGKVYEYCLMKFAFAQKSGAGEFYTPKSIVNLMVEMIEPYKGIVYDGACGSGGMFVSSEDFILNHNGNRDDISVYGQEYTPTTFKLAKMNLAIRGISANLGEEPANTFWKDQHSDLKADFALMNPPFNQKKWREKNELLDDPRWKGYSVPPTGNANYAWILNMISHLNTNGVGALVLAKGSLTTEGKEEKAIRKALLENDLIEAVLTIPEGCFYTTGIGVAIFIFNRNKKRKNNVLFMDLAGLETPIDRTHVEIKKENRDKATQAFHTWRKKSDEYHDEPGFVKNINLNQIREKDYVLTPNMYIDLKPEEDDGIPFEEKLKTLTDELFDLFSQSNELQKKIKNSIFQIK